MFLVALGKWIITNKRWTLIILLSCLCLFQKWQLFDRDNKIAKADASCEKKIADAVQPYLDAEKRGQEVAEEVSANYEQEKESSRVKTEYITREVQKIVERPIYIRDCFDADGVQHVNQAGNTSQSKNALP